MSRECIENHERARRDSTVFATFIQIGVQPDEDDDGRPVDLRLANCRACKTTVAKAVRP